MNNEISPYTNFRTHAEVRRIYRQKTLLTTTMIKSNKQADKQLFLKYKEQLNQFISKLLKTTGTKQCLKESAANNSRKQATRKNKNKILLESTLNTKERRINFNISRVCLRFRKSKPAFIKNNTAKYRKKVNNNNSSEQYMLNRHNAILGFLGIYCFLLFSSTSLFSLFFLCCFSFPFFFFLFM